MSSVTLEEKEKLWQNQRQHLRSKVVDRELEKRLNSLPPRLHLHPILETISCYLEEVFLCTFILNFLL